MYLAMDTKEFENSSSGYLVRTINGYDAYIPNPLPPPLTSFDLSFVQLISEAERALGELRGFGHSVPNPDFLIIPYTRLEAITSSRIEGTQASLSELFYFEAAAQFTPPSNDIKEVVNYLKALNYGIDRLASLPLSLRLVREIHERLMTGVRGGTPGMTPGEFRNLQNWIGPAGCKLDEATFVPPPPGERLNQVLRDWEVFLHERDTLPILIQCALIHYQFETIHPFFDGNGRVGRLLITLFLCERKILPYPLLYLSAFFEHNRDEYYSRLFAVSQDGDWDGWLRFFLRGVITQSNHAVESAKRIINQREFYRQKLQEERASASVLRLLDLVFSRPYLNLQQITSSLNIYFNTAQSAVEKLETEGILREITGQKRNRIYVARQLMKLLDENEPIYAPNEDS
jgi:Fic family protein